ncbi:MAG: InlB B-repeat-containing protein [Bacteroidales bacterium]|nr:InlB B-repeat-containing protein [Bacteroidales bacterium]
MIKKLHLTRSLAIAALAIFMILPGKGWGQLLVDDFTGTVGTALTANGWVAHSGSGSTPMTIASPGLTYSGYLSSGVGNATSTTANNEDVNKAFTSTNTGSVYCAFMITANPTTTTSYPIHFCQTAGTTAANFFCRFYIQKDASSAIQFGLQKSGETVTYTGYSYSANTTYLIVLKYTFNTVTSTDDAVYVFVNPTPGSTEPTPTVSVTGTTQNDATAIAAIALRQSSTTTPLARFDGIRVGTTWESVTPSAGKTVTFNNNGGSGTMANQVASTSTALTSNSFTRTGYTFTGWNTIANGSGTAYANGAEYSFAADLTLYAQWAINTYNLTSNAGTGGTVTAPASSSIVVNYGEATTITASANTGYTFGNWSVTSGSAAIGNTALASTTSTLTTGDATVQANFTANNNTITFDGNGSTGGSMSTQTIATGASANLTTNLYTRTGYGFNGWNTAAGGGGTSYTDGASYTMGTSNVILYAQWTIVSSPTINVTGILTSLSTTYGTASSTTTFSVSGSALTADIVITAPTGFEISTSAVTGYSNTLNLEQSSGIVDPTTIYVRLLAINTVLGSPYSGNILLNSTGATEVTMPTASSSVNTKTLTITGLTGQNKEYDRDADVTVDGTPSYTGLENSETFSVTGTVTWAFPDFLVAGSPKTLSRIGSFDAPSTNYSVTQPTLTASITAKPLTVTDATAQNKPYDGTVAATITGTLEGVISPDVVTLNGTGTFSQSDVGDGLEVISTSTLGGADAGNYSLTQPTVLTANITKADQTIIFGALPAKTTSDPDFAPGATSPTSAINTITYASSNTSVATIVSGQIHIVGGGTSTITASQAASLNYSAAADVTQLLTVTLPPIAKWTYEGITVSATAATSPSLTAGSTLADAGSQTVGSAFSAVHASSSSVWSTPSGNGSLKALSANNWAVGDYFQFVASVSGYQNIVVSCDQNGSSTGPAKFKLQYSTNGTVFTDFGSEYSIPASITWNNSLVNTNSIFSFDLSSITAINGLSTVYFRIVDNSTVAINSVSPVAPTGTSRIDNFTITGDVIPPAITVTPGTLSGFTYAQGSGPSAEKSFTVSGTDLTANLTVTPSANYEISTVSGVSFAPTNPITLTPVSGTVAITTIYARLKAGLSSGDFNSENIVVATAGTTDQNVTCSGTVTPALWSHMITNGSPIAMHYLGDKLASGTWIQFEIGQETWNLSDAGIGKSNSDPLAWLWRTADWFVNGDYPNKKVQADFVDFQFTSTGNWYINGRVKAGSGDPFNYANSTTWQNTTSFAPAYYFTVDALTDPSSQSASAVSASQINLTWTKDATPHNVMVVRKKAADSWTEPTQGTAYAVNATIGSGVVVYNSSGTSLNNTVLEAGTTYDYKFYSENYNYYSGGLVASATTLSAPTISSFTPDNACAGSVTSVTITGSNFTGATDVSFNGTQATTFTINGLATEITVDFPAGATTGKISVTTPGGTATSTGDFVVNQLPVAAGTITGSARVCQGAAAVSYSVPAITNATSYHWAYSGTGATITGSTNSVSIAFASNATAGNLTVYGVSSCGNGTVSANYAVATDPVPFAFAGPTEVGTSGTPFTLSGAIATNGTTILWTENGAGTITDNTVINPLYSAADPPIATVTFTLTVHNASCPDAISTKVLFLTPSAIALTWTGAASSTNWHDKNNWSDQTEIPGDGTNVTIPAGLSYYPTITAAALCNNITVESGASLIDNGNLTLSSGAKIIVKHPAISSGKWHLISSPLANATSGMFLGNYLYNFNSSTNNYTPILITDLSLAAIKGYALYPKSAAFSGAYVGDLNKESIYSINTTAAGGSGLGWNLVGNPYPSAIDWDAASGWVKDGLATLAIYINNGATWSSYTQQSGTNLGSRYIAPTQGFFVKGNGGTFSMTDAVRVHNTVSFVKRAEEVVPNLVRLQVTGNGYKDEAVVRFIAGATTEMDRDYDAEKLYGDVPAAAQLYTFGSNPLSINTLPSVDNVRVGIKTGIKGTYTIAATEINDLGNATLEDTELGISTDLSAGSYTFDAVAGTFDQRFILHFTMLGLTPTKNVEAAIYSYQRTVHINMKDQVKGDIFIYNISGQQVASKLSAQGTNEIKLTGTGNYIVKVISKNSTIVRKVFILQ